MPSNRGSENLYAIFQEPEPVARTVPQKSNKSFSDKIVSRPNCIPHFTKRPSTTPSRSVASSVFKEPEPTVVIIKANDNHSNPFGSTREELPSPKIRKAPEFVHADPRQTGLRHLEPQPTMHDNGIATPNGVSSGWGRRHVTGQRDKLNPSSLCNPADLPGMHSQRKQVQTTKSTFEMSLPLAKSSKSVGVGYGKRTYAPSGAHANLNKPGVLTNIIAWDVVEKPKEHTCSPPWFTNRSSRATPVATPRSTRPPPGRTVWDNVNRVTDAPSGVRRAPSRVRRVNNAFIESRSGQEFPYKSKKVFKSADSGEGPLIQ